MEGCRLNASLAVVAAVNVLSAAWLLLNTLGGIVFTVARGDVWELI